MMDRSRPTICSSMHESLSGLLYEIRLVTRDVRVSCLQFHSCLQSLSDGSYLFDLYSRRKSYCCWHLILSAVCA